MGWFVISLPGFAVTSPVVVVVAILAYALVFVGAWAFWYCLFTALGMAKGTGVANRSWAYQAMMLCHHTIVTPLAMYALSEDAAFLSMLKCFGCESSATPMIRDSAETPRVASAMVPVTLGYMLADLILIQCWRIKNRGEVTLMVVHHVLSLVSWPLTVIYNFCTTYVLILQATEFSSMFLVTTTVLSMAELKKVWKRLYLFEGMCFTLSFILIRVVGAFPQLRCLYYGEPWNHYDRYPEAGPLIIKVSATVVLPHFLNFFWAIKVVQGALANFRDATRPSRAHKE